MLGNPDSDQKIEKAIIYLVDNIEKSGHNPKLVVLHSIRVGIMLSAMDKPDDVVIAGILHDLIEDTDVTIEEIKKSFGDKVADLVLACTFDPTVTDKTEQYKDAFLRSLKLGKDSLEIRAVDIYTNSFFYKFNPKKANEFNYVMDKMKYFLSISQGIIDKHIYFQLRQRYNALTDDSKASS
ncbi:MAG: HD domain-containing protein [bacterium]